MESLYLCLNITWFIQFYFPKISIFLFQRIQPYWMFKLYCRLLGLMPSCFVVCLLFFLFFFKDVSLHKLSLVSDLSDLSEHSDSLRQLLRKMVLAWLSSLLSLFIFWIHSFVLLKAERNISASFSHIFNHIMYKLYHKF